VQARQRSVLIGLVATAIAVSACGSAVPPKEFVDAQAVFAGPNAQAANLGIPGQTSAPIAGSSSRAAGGLGGTAGGAGNGAVGPAGGAAGSSGSGSGRSHSSGAGGTGGAVAGPALGVTPGSCAGFKNTTGISDSAITIANASDISGPLPGIFKSARQAVQAFAAYFNSISSICGRKLNVETLDTGTSDFGDQQAATSACSDAFAMVGSMSAFDTGGAQTSESCGIPDVRAIAVNPQRAESKVTYSADALTISQIPTAPFEYFKKASNGAYKHAGLVYLNAGAVIPNVKSFKAAEEKMGYHFDYTTAFDVTTLSYDSIATALQSAGVQYVQYAGAYQYAVRLKTAMYQHDYHPFFAMDSVAYDPAFVALGGKAVDGTYAFVDSGLFEEADRSPEMQQYLAWLARVSPGATPTFFGEFAWGAARLFTETALKLGGRLTRQSMLAALARVSHYTANGLFSPQSIGTKQTSPCQSVIQLVNGKWVRRGAYPYICGSIVNSGTG
jgi:ABC-type branched-subunit amino acid transport system substrate-binding protein